MARRIGAAVPVALALLLALPASPAPAASTRDLYAGEAYGSFAFVGQTATAGKSAFVVLGCQAKPGTVLQNSAGSSQGDTPDQVPAEGSTETGSINTSVSAIKKTNLSKTLSSATTNDVNMLAGRITASRAKAVSATFTDANGLHTSPEGSVLSDLTIDGDSFTVSPGPNTKVTLPELGYVVLNEQFPNTAAAVPSMVVNMIHVYVTQPNSFDLPVGSQMIVSRAYSALKPNISGTLGGFAYGSRLFQGTTAQSGPSAQVFMPCLGTDGAVVPNQLAEVGQPGVFDVAGIKNTAQGTVTSAQAAGDLIATVKNVSLLNGLVTADSVIADAHALKKGSTISFDDQGSKLANVKVAGRSVARPIAPNTRIPLPGIGTLWLHRVIRLAGSIDVRMIEIDVNQSNPFGLQPGSVLQVAVAVAVVAA
jgi:hypothetical protein